MIREKFDFISISNECDFKFITNKLSYIIFKQVTWGMKGKYDARKIITIKKEGEN